MAKKNKPGLFANCLAAILLIVGCCGGAGWLIKHRPEASPEPIYPKADAETQAKRKKMIEDLQRQGIFGAMEVGSFPAIRVRSQFYLLTIDQKRTFVSVVFAYAFQVEKNGQLQASDSRLLALVDELTGKDIGHYGGIVGGLELD